MYFYFKGRGYEIDFDFQAPPSKYEAIFLAPLLQKEKEMGLDLLCSSSPEDDNGVIAHIGWFETFDELNHALITAMRAYVMEYESDAEDVIMQLDWLLMETTRYYRCFGGEITEFTSKCNYEARDPSRDAKLNALGIGGMLCWIFHDYDGGRLTPDECGEFMRTLNLVGNFIPERWFERDEFFLAHIFQYSIEQGWSVYFC